MDANAALRGRMDSLTGKSISNLLLLRGHWVAIAKRHVFYHEEAEGWIEAIDRCLADPETLGSSSRDGLERSDQEGAASMTVREFGEKYLDYVKTNLAKKSLENAARVVKSFNELFGDQQLNALSLQDLEAYKQKRKTDEVTDTTINIDVRTLKAAMQIARDWNLVKENPFANAKQIKSSAKSKAHFTDEEIVKLLGAIKHVWFKRIVRFAILTGLRRGEILNLTWGDVDFEGGTITVESSAEYRVKGGKMRRIPLSSEALAVLAEIIHGEKDQKVFLNDKGMSPTEDRLTKKFKELVRSAGLSGDLHFHSLRHTFGTKAANSGVSSNVLKAIMGHSNIKTTEGYMGTDEQMMRSQIEKVKLPGSGVPDSEANETPDVKDPHAKDPHEGLADEKEK